MVMCGIKSYLDPKCLHSKLLQAQYLIYRKGCDIYLEITGSGKENAIADILNR